MLKNKKYCTRTFQEYLKILHVPEKIYNAFLCKLKSTYKNSNEKEAFFALKIFLSISLKEIPSVS
jgi:hypothetical protein